MTKENEMLAPFLFRFLESEEVRNTSNAEHATNKHEDEPPSEPTKKTPQGD